MPRSWRPLPTPRCGRASRISDRRSPPQPSKRPPLLPPTCGPSSRSGRRSSRTPTSSSTSWERRSHMEISFDAKTVLITGAARGIGRAIAHGFAGAGARVFATDLLRQELEALRETAAPQRGGSIETRVVDATDARAVEAVLAEAAGDRGSVDVLVHAAGGVRGQSK